MKKLLHLLLLLPALSWGQTGSITMQFRSFGQRYPIYTWTGIPGGGYDTLYNGQRLRELFKLKADSVNNDGYVTHGFFNAHIPVYNFFNGITNDGSGNVGLGGVINGVSLTGEDAYFTTSLHTSDAKYQTFFGGNSSQVLNQSVAINPRIDIESTQAGIVTQEGNKIRILFNISDTGFVGTNHKMGFELNTGLETDSYPIDTSYTTRYTDAWRHKGIAYSSVNRATFTDTTIVDKGYVDSIASEGTPTGTALLKANNLSDLTNTATARANLGVTDLLATKLDTTGKSINAKRDFAAKGNAIVLTDGVTNGTTTVTSASANFVSGDIGKTIGIAYGGTDTLSLNVRKPFRTIITGINSTTSITVAIAPPATIAGPRNITGVSMTALSNIVTCSGCTMTQNDKGKQVIIPGVGPINNQTASHSAGTFPIDSNSTCYIYSVTSSTTFLVSKKALFTTSNRTVTVPGAMLVYGNDDTTPLQNAITSAINSKKKLEIPEGKYLTTGAINTTGSNLTVEGYGAGSTIIYPLGTGFSALVANHAASDTIARNVHFRSFEIDGMWLGSNVYDHTMKGILILPAIDFSLEYVTIRNCPATGFGSDFMKNYVLIGSKFIHNGRQGFEFQSISTIAGSAGVGIGTGKWQDEGGLITACYADNNFSNNYFWEGQERGQFTGGARLIGNYSTFSNGAGYGNIGTDGMVLSNNYSIYDGTGVRSDQSPYQTASNLSYEKNGEYSGNIIRNSFGTLMTILTKYGGQKITNNTLENTLPMGSTAGAKLIGVDSTGNNIREIIFQGNRIKGIRGDGLSIETGNSSETHGSVVVTGNILVDNGLSNGSPGAGIVLKGKTLNLFVRNNIAFDDRLTTSRTQAYGFYVPTAQTTGGFFYGENSFYNNITAADLYTNLTPTSYNIGQPLIKSNTASPLAIMRPGTSVNVSTAIGDDGSSWFPGKSTTDEYVIGKSANLTLGGLFSVTSSGNIKIPTAPATSAGTYDFLSRNTSTGVVEKIASSTIAPIASPTFTGNANFTNINSGKHGTNVTFNSATGGTTDSLVFSNAQKLVKKVVVAGTGMLTAQTATSYTPAVDTAIITTKANSYSLSAMQTKLNGYGLLSANQTWTGVNTYTFGLRAAGSSGISLYGTAFNGVSLRADDPVSTSYVVTFPAMTGQASIAVTNSTTVILSAATLNSTYPNAKPGTQIICDAIIAGATIYIKASGTTWLTIASTITP